MTAIEWTEESWNPITGCSRISEGCRNCYAERMSRRLAAMGQEKYQGLNDDHGRFNGVVRFHCGALHAPRKRKRPTVWFVNSMSDLFHANVPLAWVEQVWRVMAETPQHTYQILTKRAERMQVAVGVMEGYFGILPNVWLGVSTENQAAADERIPYLLLTPAAIRFLSCEPLLGPLDLKWKYLEYNARTRPLPCPDWAYNRIDWVIVGGESGPGARPMHPDWARSIRDQCQATGTAFFFKQWGGVRKKAAGRLLDGREWNETPAQ